MKARVKATGEIVEVNEFCTLKDSGERTYYWANALELITKDNLDYWTRLEHQAAIGAMQGILSNPNLAYKDISTETICNHVAERVKEIAHALLEKKKKEYPKTFEECCKILGVLNVDLCFNADYRSFDDSKEQWKRLGLMNQFYKLHICRDAYWQIAGEEMGLGKPWKPDWDNVSDKYCIYFVSGYAWSKECQTRQCPFAFPTPEMRDAFKENFDPDIEICKELL